MFCKWKDVLGKSGEGFHKDRIEGFALWDTVGTIILAWIISNVGNYNYFTTLLVLVLLAIFAHWLFCVDTKSNRLLGLSDKN